jgi:hypothetical protein
MYFIYSYHQTREAAEAALEHYFATGEVCEAERPYIDENMRAPKGRKYRVMFPG